MSSGDLPKTSAQRRCLALDALFPGTPVNTIGGTVHWHGPVVLERLAAAIEAAFVEFDGLRAELVAGSDTPALRIRARAPRIVHVDFRRESHPAQALATWVADEFAAALPTDDGALACCTLFSVSDTEHGYLVRVHHAVADGWSMSLFTAFVARAYTSADPAQHREGSPSIELASALEERYLASDAAREDRRYWQARLSAFSGLLRAAGPRTNGVSRRVLLPMSAEGLEAARVLRQRLDCSANLISLAALAVYRGHVSGDTAGVIAVPVYNRHTPDEKRLFGMLVNHLPLMYRLRPEEPFAELVMRLREDFREAREHGRLPSALIRADGDHAEAVELFDTFVNQYVFGHTTEVGELRQEVRERHAGHQAHDLQVLFGAATDGTAHVAYDVLVPAWSEARVEGLHRGLTSLLRDAAERPASALRDLRPIDERERTRRAQVLVGARRPIVESFPERFARRAALHPDAPALLSAGQTVRYGELGRWARAFAAHLAREGARAGDRIGVLTVASVDAFVASLGVLYLGGAVVPLDPADPPLRLADLCARASVSRVVHDAAGAAAASQISVPATRVTRAGEIGPALAPPPPESTAYVLFTSGSTGRPKAVPVTHRSLANYLQWAEDTYLVERDVVALASRLTFDLTVTSFYAPLAAGACVWIPDDTRIERVLEAALGEGGATVLKLTPSHLRLLLALDVPRGALRTLVVGGEAFDTALAAAVRARFPEAAIFNEYGPTEATVGCAVHRFAGTERTSSVPLGSAIPNMEVRVRSPWGADTPVGEVGELVVSGVGVVDGYLGEPELTAASFEGAGPGRAYRTADLVRFEEDAALVFVARRGAQIKLHGFRIEPGEIEHAALAFHGVTACAVVPVRDVSGRPVQLAAFVTPAAVDIAALGAHLAARLPPWLVPSVVRAVPSLPSTANGKVDHAALASMLATNATSAPAPDTLVATVLRLAAELLGARNLGADDDLMLHGLDSITAVQLASRLQRLGFQVASRDALEARSPRAIARALASRAPEVEAWDDAPGPVPRTPMLGWFLDRAFPDPARYLHVLVLELRAPAPDPALLAASLAGLVRRHDALRLAVGPGGELETRAPMSDEIAVEHFARPELDAHTVADVADRLTSRIDLAAGRLVAAGLVRTAGATALILGVHHLGVDVHAWFLVLAELDARFGGEEVSGAAQPTFRGWAQHLAARALPADRVDVWRALDAVPSPAFRAPTRAISGGAVVQRLIAGPGGHLVDHLGGRDAELRLLSALSAALAPWAAGPRCRIEMERAGRASSPDQPDVSALVGWLTALFPLALPVGDVGWSGRLEAVSAALDAVPDGGASYGLLARARREIASSHVTLRFNYLGRVHDTGWRRFRLRTDLSGLYRGHAPPDCSVVLDLTSTPDGLLVRAEHDTARVDDGEVARLLSGFEGALRDLAAHLAHTEGPRAADFDAVDIDDAELAALLRSFPR